MVVNTHSCSWCCCAGPCGTGGQATVHLNFMGLGFIYPVAHLYHSGSIKNFKLMSDCDFYNRFNVLVHSHCGSIGEDPAGHIPESWLYVMTLTSLDHLCKVLRLQPVMR